MAKVFCFISLILFDLVNRGSLANLTLPKTVPLRNRIQGRIVNGNSAEVNQFPYQVSIRSVNGSTASICGGSIISSNFVLTAAHCTNKYQQFDLGFGSNSLNAPTFKMVSYTKIEFPEFNPSTLSNDISLIKLPRAIPFSLNISPIQLPSKSQATSTYVNKESIVSGYGRTSDDAKHVSQSLNFVNMKVIANGECSKTFGSKIVTATVLCAKGLEDVKKNACLGDSGGPMAIVDERGIITQIGIVSFVSSRGCSFGDASGYTRVSKYLQWISTNAGIPLRR